MTDKTKLQTFQKIIRQQDVKDMLNQSNISLKNNKGIFKARHGGLTIKFNGNKENGNDDNLTSEISKDEILDNFYENESLPTQIKTKEVATQTETSKEKSIDNVINHTYSALTILEDKKINKIRKVIFNLKSQLKLAKEEENKLNEELSIIKDNLFELELIELKLLNDDFNRLKRSKIDEWRSDSELRTLSYFEAAIKKLTKEIIDQKIAKAKIINNLKVIALKIQKFETNIDKLQFQLAKNINKLNVPSLVLQNKINKRLALQKKFDEEDLNVKSKKNILKNIYILKNEIEKQWKVESNKVTRIYEEIINIGNNYCYITTFVHANWSITEKILYFSNDINNKFTIQEQIKTYENINEWASW